MPDTIYIVTSTAKEHGDYQKGQQRKRLVSDLWAIAIGLAGFGYLFYLAWGYVH